MSAESYEYAFNPKSVMDIANSIVSSPCWRDLDQAICNDQNDLQLIDLFSQFTFQEKVTFLIHARDYADKGYVVGELNKGLDIAKKSGFYTPFADYFPKRYIEAKRKYVYCEREIIIGDTELGSVRTRRTKLTDTKDGIIYPEYSQVDIVLRNGEKINLLKLDGRKLKVSTTDFGYATDTNEGLIYVDYEFSSLSDILSYAHEYFHNQVDADNPTLAISAREKLSKTRISCQGDYVSYEEASALIQQEVRPWIKTFEWFDSFCNKLGITNKDQIAKDAILYAQDCLSTYVFALTQRIAPIGPQIVN